MPARARTSRWWWIRHAPAQGRPGAIHGRLDPPADCVGAARELAALASRLPRGATWIISGARRARDTAHALSALTDGPAEPLIEPDLIEQDFGVWQGATHKEVADRDPEGAARFWRDPAHQAPPGGESFAAVMRRVSAAIERIAARHADGDLVLIAHAGTSRAAVAHALGLTPEAALRLSVDPLALTRLDRIEGADKDAPAAWWARWINLPPGENARVCES